jgi:hypothetical protein
VNVVVGQLGSRQRQTLLNQRTTVTRPRGGRVMQHSAAAAMSNREHPAPRAALLKPIRLHRQHEPLLIIKLNFGHVHAWNVEYRIGPGTPGRTRATHTVGHRRGLRQIAWSHLILKVPAPSAHDQHAQSGGCSTMLNCEGPKMAIELLHLLIHR